MIVTLINEINGKKIKVNRELAESYLIKGDEMKKRIGSKVKYWVLPESSVYYFDNGSILKKKKGD